MKSEHRWAFPPARLILEGDAVHVWRAFLDAEEDEVYRLSRLLSRDEGERAERFHFRTDRHRFIIARAVLRKIIGRYLGLEPERLQFAYNRYGKPALAGWFGAEEFRFNLTRSQDLALYAFSLKRKVGIDAEYVRADLAPLKVAATAFSASEFEMLKAVPEDRRTEAFFACWTRKEAYVKAKGKGLSIPLDEFDVSLLPGQPARLMNVRADPPEASRWSLVELHPAHGYMGALAVEGNAATPIFWQWCANHEWVEPGNPSLEGFSTVVHA